MGLGRHRAKNPARKAGAVGRDDVPLWGGFMTLSTGVTMGLFGMNALAIASVTAALAGGFFIIWWLGASHGTASPTGASSPSSSVPLASRARPVPGVPESLGTVDPDSRWIDAFGPPETGQLPIQRYVHAGAAGQLHRICGTDGPLPQWSHSRA